MNRLRSLIFRHRGRHEDGFSLVEMIVGMIVLGVVGTMVSVFFISIVRTSGKATARNDDINEARDAVAQLTRDLQAAVPNPNSTSPTVGPFVTAGRDNLSFYANINGNQVPALVTWAVVNPTTKATGYTGYNGLLRRTVANLRPYTTSTATWTSTATAYPTAGTTNYTKQDLLYGLAVPNNGQIPPVFRYLDETNAGNAQLCSELKPVPATCPASAAATISGDPLSAATPTPTASSTPPVNRARAVEVYLQVVSAKDGYSHSAAPYYEKSKKAGVPIIYRARVFPIINTVS